VLIVPNVSEGRDHEVIDALATACGAALLDVHSDADHHRSVFTLGGADAEAAVRRLAVAVAEHVDLRSHNGVHPRLGALDIVPFVLDTGGDAEIAAQSFAKWVADELSVPVFLYGDVDAAGRTLPDARREAFSIRGPDFGPSAPHPRFGGVVVGVRPPLAAVNCDLDADDLELAEQIAGVIRERDGGLSGVRALGLRLASRKVTQVSMNLTRLDATGVEEACTAVRDRAKAAGVDVTQVELVGLVPGAEAQRWSEGFRAWAGLGDDVTVEARLAARSGAAN
jgi:glutamate formiminotransferase